MASPIGSQRAFISIPAAIAATAPPPAVSTDSAANCAAPENTVSDISTGAIEPITGCASTPKENPPANVGAISGRPARDASSGCRSSRMPVTLPYTPD